MVRRCRAILVSAVFGVLVLAPISGMFGLHGFLADLLQIGNDKCHYDFIAAFNRLGTSNNRSTTEPLAHSSSSDVWISLSLCIDDNSEELRRKGVKWKQQYPYQEAMMAAISLWSTVTRAKVVVTLVGSDDDDTKRRLDDVIARSKGAGAAAIRVVSPFDESLGCVMESQIQRMYAYRHPDIRDEDIIVTSDVDSFPTSDVVLSPLRNRTYNAWIWQWSHSEYLGLTFPLSFIGLRSSLWKFVAGDLWGGMARNDANAVGRREWGVDQTLLSRRLLELKLCSCSNKHMWDLVGLNYVPFHDPGCFHGNIPNNGNGGWIWIHLTPGHNATDISEIKELILERKEKDMDHASFVNSIRPVFEKNKKIYSRTTILKKPIHVARGQINAKAKSHLLSIK